MSTELFMNPDFAETRLNHLQQLNNEQNEAFTQLETALTTIMSGWSGSTPELFNSKLENVRNRTVSAGIYNELQKYVDAFAFAIQTYRTNEEAARQKQESLETKEAAKAGAVGAGAVGAGAALVALHPTPGNSKKVGRFRNYRMETTRGIEGGKFDAMNIYQRVPSDLGAHNGIDINGNRGDPVLAGVPGTVAFAGQQPGYGNVVMINFVDPESGQLFQIRFAHLDSINNLQYGQTLAANDLIGGIGRTGSVNRTEGYHTHVEIRVPPPGSNTVPTGSQYYRHGHFVDPIQFFDRLGIKLAA